MMDNQAAQNYFYIVVNLMLMAMYVHTFSKKNIGNELRILFFTTLLLKLFSTFALSYIFMYWFDYQTDPQTFFKESQILTDRCINHPEQIMDFFLYNKGENIHYLDDYRSFFLIKIIAVMNFFTGQNYWINSLWFSFLSFISAWFLAISINKIKPEYFHSILFAIFFIPTTLFWSSGLLKETIAFSMLALIVALLINAIHYNKVLINSTLALIPLYTLFMLKFYILGAFLLVIIPFLLLKYTSIYMNINSLIKSILYGSFFLICLFSANFICVKIYTVGILDLIFYNYEAFVLHSKTDFAFSGLKEFDYQAFVPHLHRALWQGLCMPMPWDGKSILQILEGIFNLSTLGMIFYLMFSILTNRNKIFRTNFHLTLLIIFYVVLCAIAIAFSTPNWGTLARYKVMYMPFFYFLFAFYLSKESRLKSINARF